MRSLVTRFSYFASIFIMMLTIGNPTLNAFSWGPHVGLDALGNAVAVWQSIDGSGNYNIQTASFHPGSGWTSSATLSLSSQSGYTAIIEVDNSDNAVAVWMQEDMVTGNSNLYGAMLIAGKGTAWTTPVQISFSNQSVQDDYRLEINTNKNIVLVWTALDSSTSVQYIWASTAKVGSGWSVPVQLSN